MTYTPEEQQALAMETVDDMLKGIREDALLSPDDRAWNSLSILSLIVGSITEDDLRDSLILSGIELEDPVHYLTVSVYCSIFAASNTLIVTDIWDEGSLIDIGNEPVVNALKREQLLAELDRIKFDGIFWRDVLLTNVEHEE
jgi:hypothetical protein